MMRYVQAHLATAYWGTDRMSPADAAEWMRTSRCPVLTLASVDARVATVPVQWSDYPAWRNLVRPRFRLSGNARERAAAQHLDETIIAQKDVALARRRQLTFDL